MITIVTDSSVYIKKSEAERLGVRVVPINYTVDGRVYGETYADLNGDVESLLKGDGRYTTSHPNIAAFLSCFEEELRRGNEVLCVTMSSRLSGAFGTAHISAKQTESENVAVFDSQFTAGGLYLLVKEAKKLIDGGLPLGELPAALTAARERISIVFSVDDMTPLRNSGRIGFVRMSVGTFLNIKPILTCKDGAVVADGVVRGNTEIIKKFAEKISRDASEIVISYIGESRMTSDLYYVLRETFPDTVVTLQKIGPVLGIHLGLRVIAVSFIRG